MTIDLRVGESVRLGPGITLTLTGLKGASQARLGIKAPAHVPIVRVNAKDKRPKARVAK